MSKRIQCSISCPHKVFTANIVLGITVFLAMFYFITTGEYETVAQRVQTEAILSRIGIAGIAYSIVFLYFAFFSKPPLQTETEN